MPALLVATFAANLVIAVLMASLSAAAAGALDPDRAEREARSELRSVLRKQRTDRAVLPNGREAPTGSTGRRKSGSARPEPVKSEPNTTGPAKSGNDLPTICIGCGAK